MLRVLRAAVAAMVVCVQSPALADEGMWLLSHPPAAALKSRYQFEPTPEWLERLQKSAVRFSTGGSGSIVSPTGLVMTNHHVGSDLIQKLSTPGRNLLKTGFYAPKPEQELKCPDLELLCLWRTEDVTARVDRAGQGKAPAEAYAARKRVMSEVEREASEASGLHAEVVALYQGGRYHLYQYRRFTDVRLVFAPEEAIAFFGGDTDNFEYPRFDLDVCFFRIYVDGRPFRAEHHLAWSENGSNEGDLVFVVGHPGKTRRLFTVEHLKFLRDRQMPFQLQNLWRWEVKAQTFAGRSSENARIVRDSLFGVQNSRKAVTGMYAGLCDPDLMGMKAREQEALRNAVRAKPEWEQRWGDAWDRLAVAQAEFAEFSQSFALLEGGGVGQGSDLFNIARMLVRIRQELALPSGERLREYRDAGLESLYMELYSAAPIYDDLEAARLTSGLSLLIERLGGDDPIVRAALAGKSPRARAEELVRGTSIKEVEVRRAIAKDGIPADGPQDPMIAFALALEPRARELRTRYEDRVQAVERECYAKIAEARFAVEGESVYPDATYTLRLSFGTVAAVRENGRDAPAYTDFAGLYRRYAERKGDEGFELPSRWLERKDRLELSTPFNFISTCDIIGGNSGSPVVNRAGEVVGLIFDGNLSSLVSDFVYNGATGRAVSVDSRGIVEALRRVYDAGTLADELMRP